MLVISAEKNNFKNKNLSYIKKNTNPLNVRDDFWLIRSTVPLVQLAVCRRLGGRWLISIGLAG